MGVIAGLATLNEESFHGEPFSPPSGRLLSIRDPDSRGFDRLVCHFSKYAMQIADRKIVIRDKRAHMIPISRRGARCPYKSLGVKEFIQRRELAISIVQDLLSVADHNKSIYDKHQCLSRVCSTSIEYF